MKIKKISVGKYSFTNSNGVTGEISLASQAKWHVYDSDGNHIHLTKKKRFAVEYASGLTSSNKSTKNGVKCWKCDAITEIDPSLDDTFGRQTVTCVCGVLIGASRRFVATSKSSPTK